VPNRSFGSYGDLAVALAGNLVTLAIGLLAAWLVLRRPANAAWNFFWWRLAEIQLSMVLVFYPIMCLAGFGGDFRAIYRLKTLWVSAPLLVLHLGALALIWRAWQGNLGARARMLTGPLWDEVRGAEKTLAQKPDDVGALIHLAWAYLAVGLRREARPSAEAVLALRPELPAAHALFGQALVEDDPDRATRELKQALSAPGLDPLLCATSHLSLARLALNRAEGAVALPHACAALEGLPRDATAARLVWHAAEATGPCEASLGALNRAAARGNAVARQGLEALERLARRGAVG
jgi:tetratricopeptide (TPR) repeat protein